ncbi:MAG TPA: DUF998 domain-containing protein [Candidatus Limnocylindrales bacterium]|nr:DUF998 domain-containing protein [Candidatus Limnocylindrales bacterium]
MSTGTTRLLLLGGVVGPPIFVAVALAEGASRVGYDPIRLPISLLALGDRGWTQTGNFIVFGILMLAYSIGLSGAVGESRPATRSGPLLIAMFAIGVIGAGLFATDPGGGYPPGVRGTGSASGTLHDVASLAVFTSLPAACFVFARWFASRGARAWTAYSLVTGLLSAVGFGLTIVGFNATTDLSRVGGLIQRLTVVIGWTWLTLLALRIRRPTTGPA